MIAAKDVDSPLIKQLKSADVSSHLTFVGSMDMLRGLAKQAIAAIPPLPPQFQDLLKLPDLLSAIVLRANIGGTFKVGLTLRAVDENAAAEVELIVTQGLATARQMALANMAKMPRTNDPVQEASQKYMARLTGKFLDQFQPDRRGVDVTIAAQSNSSVALIGAGMAAYLLPATQSARGAARRMQSMNNLKQIGLALQVYHTVHQSFPPRAIFSKDGKPLLSWRVAILPYLDQEALYQKFHLGEAWDSPHNKPLAETVIAVYADPEHAQGNKTTYLAPVGKGLAWEGDKGIRIEDIRDGSSNTILLVQADEKRAVPWAKPDDWEVDLTKPADGLALANGSNTLVAFADGSVRSLQGGLDLGVLKAMLTRNGNEPISR